MSKPPLPKSLLSAYFDGEVSAEERAAVSRAAQKSPAAQQALDEYARLSESLKSLRDSVPSPQLRDAVLASIQSPESSQAEPSQAKSSQSSPPAEKPRNPSVRALLQRRWIQVAGGILAAAAAGLFLMIEFATQQQEGAAPFAANDFVVGDATLPAAPSGLALARSEPSPSTLEMASEPEGELLAAAAARSLARPKETPDVAGLATADSDEALVRTASIPADWYTQQVANDDRTPQPGDVMTYLRRVADETVVIPVTVVDVQMTAGQIRLLLAQHGIQSLPMKETGADGTGDAADAEGESSVAILVESDWGRFSAVMDDLDTLDTEGMGVATYVEWSPASKLAMMKQSSIGSASKPAVPGPPLSPSAAPPAGVLVADSDNSRAKSDARDRSPAPPRTPPSGPAGGLPAVSNGLFLQAPVTDDFVAELDQRQQTVAPEGSVPAIADSSAADQPTEKQKPSDSEGDSNGDGAKRRKFGLPFASQGPARVVFLIKKSGTAP